MTKFFTAILIMIMSAALLLSGCAKAIDENPADEQIPATDALDTEDVNVQDDEGGEEQILSETTINPAAAYGRFMEAKTVCYDAMTEQIENDDELFMTAGIELMALAFVDLQTVDMVFLSSDTAAYEEATMLMNLGSLNSTLFQEDFVLTYTLEDGVSVELNGKCDIASDSLTCVWTRSGEETLMLEFVKYKDGYAGQYYITDDGATSIIKVIFDGEDIGFGMGDVSARPESIYKSAPADFTFVDDCSSIYKIIDGEGIYISDGVEKEF